MALNVNPALIILDTFARVTAGIDENSAQGVGAAIAVQSSLMETGASVMIVHHQGKNSEAGQRGSSALLAACDFELKCEKTEEMQGKVTVTKQKDGEMGQVLGFKMSLESLSPIDPSLTSLAMHPCDESELTTRNTGKKKPKGHNEVALRALESAIAEAGMIPPIGQDRAPKGTKAVTESLWKEYWKQLIPDDLTANNQRTIWSRAHRELQEQGHIVFWKPYVWLVKETEPEAVRHPAPGFYSDDIPFP
jgi:hypothetical protein